jgi:hypothetical protein
MWRGHAPEQGPRDSGGGRAPAGLGFGWRARRGSSGRSWVLGVAVARAWQRARWPETARRPRALGIIELDSGGGDFGCGVIQRCATLPCDSF